MSAQLGQKAQGQRLNAQAKQRIMTPLCSIAPRCVAPQRQSVARARKTTLAVVAQATAAAPAGTETTLPWQVAMSEVRKRRDLKKIMIIGAGPIVIGQVGS